MSSEPRIIGVGANSNYSRVRNSSASNLSVLNSIKVASSGATIKGIYSGTFTPPGSGSVAANSSATVSVTITGISPGDLIFATPEGAQGGSVHFAGCWVSAENTLSFLWQNADAATARASSTPAVFRYMWLDLT